MNSGGFFRFRTAFGIYRQPACQPHSLSAVDPPAWSCPEASCDVPARGAVDSPLSGANAVQRPNVVPGIPFYLNESGAPGGMVINPAALTIPASGQGDLSRNALRGFGATHWDMTLRRRFGFTEKLSLQARGDFFNILNHPNFGNPINFLTSPQFGQSTQMLANYLGAGGQNGSLNPLYQIGGPRSIQIALKLQF